MTAKKCTCHPSSPFLWRHDHRPSIFAKDLFFRGAGAVQSKAQTEVVERKRQNGEEVGTIKNLSNKAREQNIISLRQFTVFARAGKVL